MKTINITSAEIEEIILRPNEEIAFSVSYRLKDAGGNVVYRERLVIEKSELPAAALTNLTNLADKILTRIETVEGIV